jgi:hypothetical protein
MEKDFVCQEEFDHKIWGAVSVIITRRNVECFLKPLISCFQSTIMNSPADKKLSDVSAWHR